MGGDQGANSNMVAMAEKGNEEVIREGTEVISGSTIVWAFGPNWLTLKPFYPGSPINEKLFSQSNK